MTLFSEIDNQFSEKDGRSPFFYRRAFRGLVTAYANNPRKFITDEKKDREGVDENLLRRVPKMGHLMMFQYQTESYFFQHFFLQIMILKLHFIFR